MTGRFFEWTPDDDPGALRDVRTQAGWDALVAYYAPESSDQGSPAGNRPLQRIIEIAKEHGVESVYVERRYIDLDFRSEHSQFFSTTFRRYPSVCHRLHFFTRSLAPADLHNLAAFQADYRGYSIMRPLPSSPVGRTMLSPPPEMEGAAICSATDEVHLFGTTLRVRAMPFVSQDAQYLRCAHAVLWMALYHAHLRHGMPRRLPSDVHDAALGGEIIGRQVPSEGLSVSQMLGALQTLGMSAAHMRLPQTEKESRRAKSGGLFARVCRYVNSQIPPLVYSEKHVWLIVGYRLLPPQRRSLSRRVLLYRHDDARGPYLPVSSPWREAESDHSPWKAIIPPLPQKIYLTDARAELAGKQALRRRARLTGSSRFLQLDATRSVRFITYATSSEEFKAGVLDRLPREIALRYCEMHLPRHIWVVEAAVREPAVVAERVLGEAVLDATAHHASDRESPVLAVHLLDGLLTFTPDYEQVRLTALEHEEYNTGLPAYL